VAPAPWPSCSDASESDCPAATNFVESLKKIAFSGGSRQLNMRK
jgi:hypothetical protein